MRLIYVVAFVRGCGPAAYSSETVSTHTKMSKSADFRCYMTSENVQGMRTSWKRVWSVGISTSLQYTLTKYSESLIIIITSYIDNALNDGLSAYRIRNNRPEDTILLIHTSTD